MTPDELAHAAVDRLLERVLGEHLESATITVERAGELMGVGRSAAYEAARTGQLPSVRIGRRVVVPVPALAALLLADGSSPPASNGKPRLRGRETIADKG